jgi:serine/threonine protein kinase
LTEIFPIKVQNEELSFPENTALDPHLNDLISKMLTKDPARRITLEKVMSHEWVTKEASDPLPPYDYENSNQRIEDTLSDAERREAIEKPKEPGTNFAKQLYQLQKTASRRMRKLASITSPSPTSFLRRDSKSSPIDAESAPCMSPMSAVRGRSTTSAQPWQRPHMIGMGHYAPQIISTPSNVKRNMHIEVTEMNVLY